MIKSPTNHQILVAEAIILILFNKTVKSPWKEMKKQQIGTLVKKCKEINYHSMLAALDCWIQQEPVLERWLAAFTTSVHSGFLN